MLTLSALIMSGCATTRNEVVLPPEPERQELKEPESLKDLALTLNYYESLLEEWEAWGAAVKRIINGE